MEILIVITMLAILSTVIYGSYLSSLKKGRDSRRKQDLEQIAKALELYYSEQGYYPTEEEIQFGSSLIKPKKTPTDPELVYMNVLPFDAVSGYRYIYQTSSNQQEYRLYACLENVDDLNYKNYQVSCGQCGFCHYGIASPNTQP